MREWCKKKKKKEREKGGSQIEEINWTLSEERHTERAFLSPPSPRAVGLMFIVRELWWDLIVPFFV